ncbi:50S ribosomal protein L4 [Candidatus Saccharibacteria bacterium]|nr:50S ribosomal protein L4 [Candidatus Saccharibacteria bacterium]
MAVITYSKSGTKSASPAKLDKSVFEQKVDNHELLKQAYLSYIGNARQASAIVKTRGLVSGGGRKPWKQKGTGRARFGSSRNPIWRGGGIVFGPNGNENYTIKLGTNSRRQALRQALSLSVSENKVKVIEQIQTDGKTKDFVALLNKIDVKGSVLLVVAHRDLSKENAARNVPFVEIVGAKSLNVFDVVNADTILINKDSLDLINERLSLKKGVQ